MTRKPSAKTSRAFTLVEVLVALGIASTAMLGLLKLHLMSIRTADGVRARTQAVFFAQEKIAETLAAGYPALKVDSGSAETDGLEMNWRMEVAAADSPDIRQFDLKGLRQLSVDVTWKQGTRTEQIQVSTYVANSQDESHGTRP
jgi:general secretion pathway protein I